MCLSMILSRLSSFADYFPATFYYGSLKGNRNNYAGKEAGERI